MTSQLIAAASGAAPPLRPFNRYPNCKLIIPMSECCAYATSSDCMNATISLFFIKSIHIAAVTYPHGSCCAIWRRADHDRAQRMQSRLLGEESAPALGRGPQHRVALRKKSGPRRGRRACLTLALCGKAPHIAIRARERVARSTGDRHRALVPSKRQSTRASLADVLSTSATPETRLSNAGISPRVCRHTSK
jgi:hypothetical protein